MSASLALATAATFVWLGMVLAISFLETPLKFRAPGVTVQIGLGIGRLVFRALNGAEVALAAAVVIGLLIDPPRAGVTISAAVTALVLIAQVALVRPLLSRRTDRVLDGEVAPRSSMHLWYVALEVVKVVALVTLGILLLSS